MTYGPRATDRRREEKRPAATTPPRSGASVVFARSPGTCPECCLQYPPGTPITTARLGAVVHWVHSDPEGRCLFLYLLRCDPGMTDDHRRTVHQRHLRRRVTVGLPVRPVAGL